MRNTRLPQAVSQAVSQATTQTTEPLASARAEAVVPQAGSKQSGEEPCTAGSEMAAASTPSGSPASPYATVEKLAAFHCHDGSSDKLWAAALLRTADDAGALITCWGRRSALALQTKVDATFATFADAAKAYSKKCGEKEKGSSDGKLYVPIAFDAYDFAGTIEQAARRNGLSVSLQGASTPRADAGIDTATASATEVSCPAPRLHVSHVTVLPSEDLDTVLADLGLHGVTEKVNGARCLVRWSVSDDGAIDTPSGTDRPTGRTLSYNRRGIQQLSVPAGAVSALRCVAVDCVIDGERMEGDQAGLYVAFDLLECRGEDIRAWPYIQRINTLRATLVEAGVIRDGAPTLAEALSLSAVDSFALLTPATQPDQKRATFERVRAAGGEGIIVRTLHGQSHVGDTREERKHKFVKSIDVIGYAIAAGQSGGSVRMGLLRTSDHALIDVGAVRSGLTQQDLAAITTAIKQGAYPTLEVTFLPIRTVGIALVEPSGRLRTDKPASACTTAQLREIFGSERDQLIASAPAVAISNIPGTGATDA